MLAREEARLRALFRKLLRHAAVAAVGTVACACSPADGEHGGAVDASVKGEDATAPHDGSAGNPSDACSDRLVVLDAPGDGSNCEYFQQIGCGLPTNIREGLDASRSGCALFLGICYSWCSAYGNAVNGCNVVECDDAGNLEETESGAVTIDCVNQEPRCTGTVGRRPKGLWASAARGARGDARGPVAAWLAECARLEGASVRAFRELRDELEALGAPRELVRAAGKSAWDEVRHARVVARLARAYGANGVRAVRTRRKAARKRASSVIPAEARAERLLALAVENAVEGCVRETFGAFVATRQAEGATDARVRGAMRGIAEDETRHAALAWAIAAWVGGELGAGGRKQLAAALHRESHALDCEVARTPPELGATLAVPTRADGSRLASALLAELLG
jgi:hypothetical protein